jgi:hypothetical protein
VASPTIYTIDIDRHGNNICCTSDGARIQMSSTPIYTIDTDSHIETTFVAHLTEQESKRPHRKLKIPQAKRQPIESRSSMLFQTLKKKRYPTRRRRLQPALRRHQSHHQHMQRNERPPFRDILRQASNQLLHISIGAHRR